MNRKACTAEISNNHGGCFIAHDEYELNIFFHLCDQPAVDAVDFFGRTVWLCAGHFDVFAPTYKAAF
jgi:hypothetical protein